MIISTYNFVMSLVFTKCHIFIGNVSYNSLENPIHDLENCLI